MLEMSYVTEITASRIDIHRIIATLNAVPVPLYEVTIIADDWIGDYLRTENPRMFLTDPKKYKQNTLLLAVDQDDTLYEIIGVCIRFNISFYPVRHADRVARYWHFNRQARLTLQEEKERQTALGLSHWDSADFANIIQAIDITKQVAGSYVEIGTFNGASGCLALSYMTRTRQSRACFFFDVFEGFSYDSARESTDAMWLGTHETDGYKAVADRLTAFESDILRVSVHRMDVTEDPVPAQVGAIAVANIDVDMFEAVLAALTKCSEHMSVGGIMIVEDAGHTPMLIGARFAVHRFLQSEHGKCFIPVYLESGQTYLIKH